MTDLQRLPWRLDERLTRLFGRADDLELHASHPGVLPVLRGALPRPAETRISLIVRVHSTAGIPLAHAAVNVQPGDQAFEVPVKLLAMEGYEHLGHSARQAVERRVWSRRAYATGSAA